MKATVEKAEALMDTLMPGRSTPNRPTTPLRLARLGTAALVAALSIPGAATADLVVDQPDGFVIRSQGSVSTGARVRIEGDLGAAGSASFGNGSVVTGDVSTGTPYSWYTPSVDPLATGSANIQVGKDQTLALAAGEYGKFTSSQGASLILGAGNYSFLSFSLGRSGSVIADTSMGDIYLSVANTLSTGSHANIQTIGPGRLYLVMGGSGSFGSHSSIEASVYARGALSYGSSTTLTGTSWSGGSTSIGADSTFRYASVPAPSAIALLALAGWLGVRRRR